jgi:hypothetical protein
MNIVRLARPALVLLAIASAFACTPPPEESDDDGSGVPADGECRGEPCGDSGVNDGLGDSNNSGAPGTSSSGASGDGNGPSSGTGGAPSTSGEGGGDSSGSSSSSSSTSSGGPSNAAGNDCCANNITPGCKDTQIEACVCAADDYCCTTAWDSLCVSIAQSQCQSCQGSTTCVDGGVEPNDSEAAAHPLSATPIIDCNYAGDSVSGTISGSGDADWYKYSGDDTLLCVVDPSRSITATNAGLRVCKFVECEVGPTQVNSCPANATAETSPDGRAGCCAGADFDMTDFDCPDVTDDNVTVYIRIDQPGAVATTCNDYTLAYHL